LLQRGNPGRGPGILLAWPWSVGRDLHIRSIQESSNPMPNPRQDEPSATGYKALDKAADAAEATARQAAEAVDKEARTFADKVAGAPDLTAETIEAVSQAAPEPAAISQATQAVASRMREFSNEWVQAFRDQATKNVESVARLAACRSPFDLMRLQTELAREGLNDSVALARRLNSASLRALGAIAQDGAKAATPPSAPG
jgi:hypothetical protein